MLPAEVIGIRENSVRVRSGLFVVDIKVIETDGKKRIVLPQGSFYISNNDFRKLAAIVLRAHTEKSIRDAKEKVAKERTNV